LPIGRSFYHRSFIVLQKGEEGYGITGGRIPIGHCKVEIRGTRGILLLVVQNLKPVPAAEGRYACLLVTKGEQGFEFYDCGDLEVDMRGRGQLSWDFDAQNVNGRGIDQYHAICIAHIPSAAQSPEDIFFPLVGYADKRTAVSWKPDLAATVFNSKFGFRYRSAAAVQEAEPEEEQQEALNVKTEEDKKTEVDNTGEEEEKPDMQIEQVETINVPESARKETEKEAGAEEQAEEEVKTEEEVKAEEEVKTEEEVKAEEEMKTEEEAKEEEQLKEEDKTDVKIETEKETEADTGAEKEVEKEKAEKAATGAQGYSTASYKVAAPQYWEKVREYFETLFSNQERVQPFEQEIPESEWIRIRYNNTYASSYMQDPYAYMGKYYPIYGMADHYIIGLLRSGGQLRYICYGVPGRYSILPPAGLKGFCRWVPAKGYYGMGYWLMYMDADTGETVYPY